MTRDWDKIGAQIHTQAHRFGKKMLSPNVLLVPERELLYAREELHFGRKSVVCFMPLLFILFIYFV